MKFSKLLLICIISLGFTGNVIAELNDGLIAYWSFDNCDGTDDSNNGYDGVVHGNIECINGVNNNGIKLDKSNEGYIMVNKDIKLNIPSYTINAWYKIDDPGQSWNIIISRMTNSTTNSQDAWDLTLHPDSSIYYWYSDPYQKNSNYCCTTLGEWNFISVRVSDGNGNIFLNGQLVETFSTGILSSADNIPTCIGCNDYNYPPFQLFNGSLDEIRIYDRALSETEIIELSQVDNNNYTGECWATYEEGKLHIPCVKVKDPLGNELKYKVDMEYIIFSEPMKFELIGAEKK